MKIFETQFEKGSYISTGGDVGTPNNVEFKRTEKGNAIFIDESLGSNRIDLPAPVNCGLISTVVIAFRLDEVTSHSMLIGLDGESGTYISIRDNNRLYVSINTESRYTSYTPDKEWHHLIVTRNNTTAIAYLDNVYLHTYTYSTGGVGADFSFDIIGNSNGYALPAGGYISKIKVYDHIFTAQERVLAYNEFLHSSPVAIEKYPRYNPHSKPTDLSRYVDSGLVLAYNMIPQGDTLVDISGSGNDGTINGAQHSIDGLVFDGIEDYIDRIQLSEISVSTSFTVACRIELKDLTPSQVIWGNGNGANDRFGLSLETNNLCFESYNGSSYIGKKYIGIGAGILNVVCVGVNNAHTLYVNGVEIDVSAVNSELSATTSRFTIGSSHSGAARFFNGEVEDLLVYNYAFTEQQAKDYNNSFAERIHIIEDFSLDPVGTTVPREWIPGTGSYEVRELTIQLGQLITNGGFDADTNWSKQAGWSISGGTAVGTAVTGNLWQTARFVQGKTYRIKYTITDYVSGDVFVSCGTDGNGTKRTANGTYIEDLVCVGNESCYFKGVGLAFTGKIDNVSSQEIPPLPGWRSGQKYLQCTSAGLMAMYSKIAYGTWEWDWKQGVSSRQPTILFVNNEIADWVTSPGSYTALIVGGGNDFRFYSNTTNKFSTVVGYLDTDVWYRMKVTRTKDGEFYFYIKGGSFGSNWVQIVAASGSNPITDNTTTTSKYFIINLDIADCVTNIKITGGVLQ